MRIASRPNHHRRASAALRNLIGPKYDTNCARRQRTLRFNGKSIAWHGGYAFAVSARRATASRTRGQPYLAEPIRGARRHAHRLERAPAHGRRRHAERRCLPPRQGRPLSRHPHLWPLRQGPGLPGRLSERLAAHGGETPGRDSRLQQQIPELGGGRPREVGAARLCLHACRLARLRPLAGVHRSFLAARNPGFLRLHRMGGETALVERQNRPQRRLLLRHQPMARGVPAAAPPRRHVHLGRRGRLVSRYDAPWRHTLHILGELVRHAGEDRAVRRGRARQEKPLHRRAGVRPGKPVRLAARAQSLRLWRRDPRASPRRRVSQGALAQLGQDQGALAHGRQLGRPGAASARQFRGLRARCFQAEMAGGAWARALDALLHRLWPPAAARVLRPFSARQEQRLGQAAARAPAGAPSRRVRRPRGERVAARTHQVDQAPSRPRRRLPRREKVDGYGGAELRGHGKGPHLPHCSAR